MRSRKYVLISVIILIVLSTAFFGYKIWDTLQTKKIVNNNIQLLPAITFRKLDGSLLNLDSFRNRKELLVLNYFNSECDHCQNMVKELFRGQVRLRDVHWLMISTEKIETIQHFADSMRLAKLPTVALLRDTALYFVKKFGVVSTPSFYVYKNGQLVRKHSGECSIQSLLQ